MQYAIDSNPALQAQALGYLLPFLAFAIFCIGIFAGLLYYGMNYDKAQKNR